MKIAITGTIGSGKSTVVDYIISKGYRVFDCDKYAHELLRRDDIIKIIGSEFDCIIDNQISRKKLGKIVFNDQSKLELLNSIIHPHVKAAILQLEEPVFVDIPLLFEAKMESLFDIIITISASKETIVGRLIKRDDMSEVEALKRISLQIDEKIKKSNSDYVIINDETKEILYKNVDSILGGIPCLKIVQDIK